MSPRPPAPARPQFEQFKAASLYCPKCQRAQPVDERLLLILPDGELYEYVCQFCWTQLGKRRVEHRQASLEELGRLAEPQMTKDAVAGRIRRLLSMADRKAKQDGIPDTESAVTPDLLEDA